MKKLYLLFIALGLTLNVSAESKQSQTSMLKQEIKDATTLSDVLELQPNEPQALNKEIRLKIDQLAT